MAPAARYEADTRGGDGSLRQELAARIAGGIQRANHLLGAAIAGRSWNITDATPKVIAVAKVRANIVIHICSSIAWQAGARPVSQPPAPGKEPQPMIRTACAYYWRQARHFFAIDKTCHSLAMLAGQRLELAISVCSNCLQIAVLNTPHAPRGEARGGRGLETMILSSSQLGTPQVSVLASWRPPR